MEKAVGAFSGVTPTKGAGRHSIFTIANSRNIARSIMLKNQAFNMVRNNRIAPADLQNQDIRDPSHFSNTVSLEELGFEKCNTEEEQLQQLKKLRDMPCPVGIKKNIRHRLLDQKVKAMSGWKGWKTRRRRERRRCMQSCQNLTYKIDLWRGSFKEIEGHFGSGVVSYFIFLKWLFQLNLGIFILLLLFVVLPQVGFGNNESSYKTPCTSTNSSFYDNLKWFGDVAQNCSAGYESHIASVSSVSNESNYALAYIADFIQGTGFMEDTILFYGYYSSMDLSVNIDGISNYVKSYDLPLAYIVVTGCYYIISLIMMVRQSAQGFKALLVSNESKFYQFCNKTFATWDFGLSDIQNVALKKKSIFTEYQNDVEEKRESERREKRTSKQLCGLYTVRIVINLFVLGALGGSGYLIFYMTQLSSEIITTWPEYSSWNLALQFLIEFLPSLTITVLNIIVPKIFEQVVRGEDYTPGIEVQITLFRTVFLRLASLGILFATLYAEINCSSKDYCNVGVAPCQPLYCWETGIGQQLYKLVITDIFVAVAVALLVEFPRQIIATKCNCKLAGALGGQEFVLPKNVLDLVYSQVLCWLGAFFSPLLPALCLIKLFILFYLKKVSLLANFVPNSRPYRASNSNTFFTVVLLVSFIVCCFPLVYVLAVMTPSRGCGPFRPYEVMYDAVTVTMCTWPNGFQKFLAVITSVAFNFPVIMVLCLTIYYQTVMYGAQKERVTLLKDQLLIEGKDKQMLVAKLNKLQQEGRQGLSTREKQRQVQNTLVKQQSVSHTINTDVPLPVDPANLPEVSYEQEEVTTN